MAEKTLQGYIIPKRLILSKKKVLRYEKEPSVCIITSIFSGSPYFEMLHR